MTTTTTFTCNLLDCQIVGVRADGSTAKSTFDPAGNLTDHWEVERVRLLLGLEVEGGPS